MILYHPFLLRIYTFTLMRLNDYDWAGGTLFDNIKCEIRKSGDPNSSLLKSYKKEGLLYYIGSWVYEEYVFASKQDYHTNYIREVRELQLHDYLELMISFLKHHHIESEEITKADQELHTLNRLFESHEDKYYHHLTKKKVRYIYSYIRVYEKHMQDYERLKKFYIVAIANFLFQSRPICEYVSKLIYAIGFDGREEGGKDKKPTVSRIKRRPEWLRSALLKRENYKCSYCNTEICLASMTIDHILPIACGGVNDIVNLQACCATCNNSKGKGEQQVNDSVTDYFSELVKRKQR